MPSADESACVSNVAGSVGREGPSYPDGVLWAVSSKTGVMLRNGRTGHRGEFRVLPAVRFIWGAMNAKEWWKDSGFH
jgi:hypothetical protein